MIKIKRLGNNPGKYYPLGIIFLLVFIFGLLINDALAEKAMTIGPSDQTSKIIMGTSGSKVGIGGDPGANGLYVNGNTNITGTITAGGFSGPLTGTLNAQYISSGTFGNLSGGGNYVFPATLTVNNGIHGNLYERLNSYATRIANPKGGSYFTTASSATGAIAISLPTKVSDTMISFWVDIYDYNDNTTFSVFVSGYPYSTPGVWSNTSALVIGSAANRNYNVRFGGSDDNTHSIIYIGETNSTWSYPQITVRDVTAGYNTDVAEMDNLPWSVYFETSLKNVHVTRSANFPFADWNRIINMPGGTFITSNNIASQTVSNATTATNLSGGSVSGTTGYFSGNLSVSMNNATGGGIILSDDGDIADLNDAYASMRFSSGVRIFSANKGGTPVITLGSNGVVTASSFSGAMASTLSAANVSAGTFGANTGGGSYSFSGALTAPILHVNQLTSDASAPTYSAMTFMGWAWPVGNPAFRFTTHNDAGAGNYEKMVIMNGSTGAIYLQHNGGNFGIGTTNPTTKAYVYGTLTVDPTGQSGNNYSEGIRIGAASNGYSVVTFGADPSSAIGSQANQWWIGRYGGDNGFNIFGNSPGNVLHILPNGNVGIGNISPGYKLDVSGDINTPNYVYAGELYTRDNVYLAYMGNWLSNLLNQNVRTDAGPTFANVYNNGWFRNNNALQGMYNQALNMHVYASSGGWNMTGGANYPKLIFRDDHESTIRGYVYSDSSGFGMLNNQGNWMFYSPSNNQNVQFPAWGHWISEAATHRGEGTNFIDYSYGMYDAYRGGWRTSNDLYVAYAYNSGNADTVDGIHSSWLRSFDTWQYNHYSGSDGAEYATIFYDTNNSGYYVNPDSVSILNDVRANIFYDLDTNYYIDSNAWSRIYGMRMVSSLEATNGNGSLYLGGNVHLESNNGNQIYLNYYSGAGIRMYGTVYMSQSLSVDGAIYGASFQYSDMNLKKNIATINNPLDKISQLRGVTFNWKKDDKVGVGLIAQEVEKVYPELVSTSADGSKAVQYSSLVAPLIEAVKAQQGEISDQQKIIDQLNVRLNALEAKKR